MFEFLNTKSKIIAAITGAVVVVGGVTFAFRDEFLSNKSLYLKIEAENIEMMTKKVEEIKKEDMLGLFFADGNNKYSEATDFSLNIAAEGFAKDIANFVNTLNVSVNNETIKKEDYKNKEIKLSYGEKELISGNIVNDKETVGLSIPKLYDKWVVTDMSLAEFIAEIIKSDEATGTTNTISLPDVKAVFELSKIEKKDLENNLKFYKDKFEKTLKNVEFTKASDDVFYYDENSDMLADSITLELSEVEVLARASQMLDKVKESGQLLDFVYDKVADIKEEHGEKNIITDKIPEKKEVINKINNLLEKIDARLIELNIEDVSALFDEEDNYIGMENLKDNKYAMKIYYDNDYKILKREIGMVEKNAENEEVFNARYEIVLLENDNERFYMLKTPEQVLIDRVEVDNGVSTHNILKSYYKESVSFEGFKLNKVQKWHENEKVVTIEVDSSNESQKIITVEIPSIKSFKFFVDITRNELSKNELNVITKAGLDIKGQKQYATFNKTITKNANVEKVDIYSNSININESTQEKVEMITDVVKGNTEKLSEEIEKITGFNFSKAFEKVKDVPKKAIDTYKSLNALGLIR